MDTNNFRSDSDFEENISMNDVDSDSTETSSNMNEETDSSSSCDADISSSEEENIHSSTLNPILYIRNKVLKEDVINVMKWAEENSKEASKSMFDTIISILKNKTIIQIQIYGIGV